MAGVSAKVHCIDGKNLVIESGGSLEIKSGGRRVRDSSSHHKRARRGQNGRKGGGGRRRGSDRSGI